MLIDQRQQMIFWNLICQSEVVEQRFRAGMLTRHSLNAPTMAIHSGMVKTMLPNTSHCHTDPIEIS
jgi:hypothetical protein